MDSMDLTQAAFCNLSYAEVLVLLFMIISSTVGIVVIIYLVGREQKKFNAKVRHLLTRPPGRRCDQN